MRWTLLIAGLLGGCYQPQPQAGAPCPNNVCPDGLVCSPASMTCERSAVDGGAVDGHPFDAAIADTPQLDALVPDAPPAGPQLVQQKSRANGTATSLSLTLDTPPTSGNTLVMMGAGPSAPLDGVSGGGVATWTRAAFSPVHANVEIWVGVTDGSSSTVTITLASSDSSLTMMVNEWSGLATTLALDGATADAGMTSPASAGPISTTHAHDLLLFAVADFTPNTFGTPAGFTALAGEAGQVTGVNQVGWYREVTSIGTYSPSVTETRHEWDACLIALEVAP